MENDKKMEGEKAAPESGMEEALNVGGGEGERASQTGSEVGMNMEAEGVITSQTGSAENGIKLEGEGGGASESGSDEGVRMDGEGEHVPETLDQNADSEGQICWTCLIKFPSAVSFLKHDCEGESSDDEVNDENVDPNAPTAGFSGIRSGPNAPTAGFSGTRGGPNAPTAGFSGTRGGPNAPTPGFSGTRSGPNPPTSGFSGNKNGPTPGFSGAQSYQVPGFSGNQNGPIAGPSGNQYRPVLGDINQEPREPLRPIRRFADAGSETDSSNSGTDSTIDEEPRWTVDALYTQDEIEWWVKDVARAFSLCYASSRAGAESRARARYIQVWVNTGSNGDRALMGTLKPEEENIGMLAGHSAAAGLNGNGMGEGLRNGEGAAGIEPGSAPMDPEEDGFAGTEAPAAKRPRLDTGNNEDSDDEMDIDEN